MKTNIHEAVKELLSSGSSSEEAKKSLIEIVDEVFNKEQANKNNKLATTARLKVLIVEMFMEEYEKGQVSILSDRFKNTLMVRYAKKYFGELNEETIHIVDKDIEEFFKEHKSSVRGDNWIRSKIEINDYVKEKDLVAWEKRNNELQAMVNMNTCFIYSNCNGVQLRNSNHILRNGYDYKLLMKECEPYLS